MAKIDRALTEFREMDELSAKGSPLHRLHPLVKLTVTILYIVLTVSFDKYQLSGLVVMALYPALLFQVGGVSLRRCFYKLRIVLPLVCAVGLFNPFLDTAPLFRIGGVAVSGGVVSMLTLMLKGVLCLTASYLLVATTSMDAICAALRRLHVPGLLVTLLLLTYRYIAVMMEELEVMTQAYHLRAPNQKGIHVSAWGSFLGQLLLRSMDRAEELYQSMLLRGFHDHFHYAAIPPFRLRDGAALLLSAGVLLLFRLVNVAQALGSLFV